MGNCAKLKWNRRALGLTQRQFADKVGVSAVIISKLELDETAWLTLRPETEAKIVSQFSNSSTWELDENDVHSELREIDEENTKETVLGETADDESPTVNAVRKDDKSRVKDVIACVTIAALVIGVIIKKNKK